MDFVEFPKIARLSREMVITEKLDGTNACVSIRPFDQSFDASIDIVVGDLCIRAGSRSRWISPGDDNFGFAKFVHANSGELSKLGEGTHFGEWWGAGIQRRYDMKEKVFSLFNVGRWENNPDMPTCCRTVPVLWRGEFGTLQITKCLQDLAQTGSAAAPGFMKPEGIIIWHTAARLMFKKTIEKDDEPKSANIRK